MSHPPESPQAQMITAKAERLENTSCQAPTLTSPAMARYATTRIGAKKRMYFCLIPIMKPDSHRAISTSVAPGAKRLPGDKAPVINLALESNTPAAKARNQKHAPF